MPSDVPIAYAAHTATCTFLLDAEGFCRRVMTRNKHHKESRVARRCLGAQYVASLDLRSEAGLVEMPTPGAAMIFARIDDGRVALVKTAPLERFDERNDDWDEAPPSRSSSALPAAPATDPYEDDEMDGRTRQVRAVRDAGVANPELSRKYQELLDRAARPARVGASRRGRTGEHAAVDLYAEAAVAGREPDEPYEADGPTLFRRAPVRAQPQTGQTGERRGMLPKRTAVLAEKSKRGSGDR